ncbi:MAG TPA: hypothetical protein VHN77_06140 [Phycisphaerales bacterium]|nr:hypothetical protein [Phycisphaerales bacterium]
MARRPEFPLWLVLLVGGLFTCAIAACVVMAQRGHPAEALLGAVIILVGSGVIIVVAGRPGGGGGTGVDDAGAIAGLVDKVEELSDTVREMAAHSALSHDARRVLFRKQERDLLLQAIEEDIAEGQWDAAAVLVKELESRLGYTVEAAALRERIRGAREGRGVQAAVAVPLVVPAERPAAVAEPVEVPEITVPAADGARIATKQELESRFMAAANEGRAEAAMGILAELDQYLTPEEAGPLREIARGVIAKTRDAMGEQFKAAVQAKRWPEAVSVGEQIVAQFPNTRMAAEVRDVMDALKARA